MSTATTDREPTSSSQHDAQGRFTSNNKGGPGNPFARRVAELRSIFLRSATEENVDRLAALLREVAVEQPIVGQMPRAEDHGCDPSRPRSLRAARNR